MSQSFFLLVVKHTFGLDKVLIHCGSCIRIKILKISLHSLVTLNNIYFKVKIFHFFIIFFDSILCSTFCLSSLVCLLYAHTLCSLRVVVAKVHEDSRC